MSVEANKLIVRRLFEEDLSEADASRRERVAVEIIAPDFRDPTNPPGMQHGPEGHQAVVSLFFRSFSAMQWRIESMIAEGDQVAVKTTMTGRHDGDFFGVPPTGIDVTVPGIHILTLRGGKIVLHEGVNDDLALMRQLGVIPAFA